MLDQEIDTLILGCTHYPLLKSEIRGAVGKSVGLVDSAVSCAGYAAKRLGEMRLLAKGRRRKKTRSIDWVA